MNREDIIRMAREAGIEWQSNEGITGRVRVTTCGSQSIEKIERFFQAAYAAGAAAERKRSEQEMSMMSEHCAELILIEREACAKVAGWLWQQFQDIKDAHERNSMEPFVPGQFGFDQSTVQQSKRMMDAIRARGQA